MKHTGLFCLKCGTVVFSCAGHDFHRCTCGNVAVDGGFNYLRISYKTKQFMYLEIVFPRKITKATLYKAWNEGDDSVGSYKVGEWPDFIQKAILKVQTPKSEPVES